VSQVLRMYPALKESKAGLEFGFKIEYEALTEKQEVTVRYAPLPRPLLNKAHASLA
jgi:hypothetical protein